LLLSNGLFWYEYIFLNIYIRLILGFRCEYPPSECQRLQQASLSVKCNDPHLCIVNDTEKLRQLNQLTTYTCRTERDRILDNYFTCINEQKFDYCHCPSRKIKSISIVSTLI